ncbi:unnamed protein product [Dicrocoelium dendriticum]|nr:unnamed protein product [Dicrocoelium dendriticum]
MTSQPAPDPPGNLTARLVTIDDRWLISWTAPPMDEGGENNGVKIIGYRVTFNETEVKRVSSPFLTSAIVMLPRCPNAEFRGTIKVQSIGASEVFSEAVDMALNAA